MRALWSIVLVSSLITLGCSSGQAPQSGAGGSNLVVPTNASMNKDDYPVFPEPDAGADPAVPADQGGKGFTGEGWQTNTNFDIPGDPKAAKGGVLRDYILDFPGTLRIEGPESNSQLMYEVGPMIYEGLLGLDGATMEWVPSLATHWQVSEDRMTFRYRINPNARFSDGTPVTSADVVKTWDFMMDKGLQSPSNMLTFGKLNRPVAESKYIVKVTAKDLNWRNFLYFSGMSILPSHILNNVTGEQYLKDYNFKMLPGTGPYIIREEDVDKGKSVTVRKRNDYWGEKSRGNVGVANFGELRFVVVRDQNLAFEMFKKGELDFFYVSRSKVWVEETNFESVQRGLVQKRKIFNFEPQGTQGLAFNMRREPWNDVRVRKALTLLFNRQLMIEKLMYNEYVPMNSHYSHSPYENPNNPKNLFDPEAAAKLLAEAGWSSRDAQGRLVKNGKPLSVEVVYASKTSEPMLTIYQEDLRKAGVTLNLRLVTPETQFQLINERRFEVASLAWGALLFPNPETSYHSRMADVENTNNITGIKDPRIDALMAKYDLEFDTKRRIELIREIDGLLAESYHYILEWSAPSRRILFWNKFGYPNGLISRTGDVWGAGTGAGIPQLWWIDPAKEQALMRAQADPSIKLEVGPVEDRYWLEREQKKTETAPEGRTGQ